MGDLVLLTATGGLLATIFWLGRNQADPLQQTLVRPALLALISLLLLVLTLDVEARWPFGLTASACLAGIWESYSGVYILLASPIRRRSAVDQVRICGIWLINAVSNLILLNLSALLAYPATFQWRAGSASLLDVAYFTVLTFASGGYGDVLPGTALGKLLAMLTSLCGLTYATILFASLFHRFRED